MIYGAAKYLAEKYLGSIYGYDTLKTISDFKIWTKDVTKLFWTFLALYIFGCSWIKTFLFWNTLVWSLTMWMLCQLSVIRQKGCGQGSKVYAFDSIISSIIEWLSRVCHSYICMWCNYTQFPRSLSEAWELHIYLEVSRLLIKLGSVWEAIGMKEPSST